MGGFDDLAAQLDPDDDKRKGRQFELVCQWFLENDPTYKSLLRRVWLWKDWPGNWGIDAGIDLVAEDHEKHLWAIQAKAYAPTYSVTKRDVDKFVSESSRGHFAYRMLIATTDQRHHLARRLMDDLGIAFLGVTQLEENTDWPASLEALRPAKPGAAKKPYDYQQTAIKDVVEGFKTAERGQLIMACGTGKTLTAWFIREKLAAQRTLVLVPSLSLLKQTMREWRTANPKRPFDALPVCSDQTVNQGEDAAISHTSDLGEPATTDAEMIAAFLRKRSRPRVVFATYQSSPQIAKAFALGRVPAFDLVVADEAHRVAGALSSDFATILDPDAIKAQRRLFMTATPRYYTGRVIRAARESEDEIASMDDHTKFGEVFHKLGFSEAIERKLLTDYQVAIIGVDDATYRDWVERGKLLKLDGRKTDARSLAGQIGLAKAMRNYDLQRVISFHGRVKSASVFATSMPEVIAWMPPRQRPKGTLWSQHASGAMTAGQRHILLQRLKKLDNGERGLLANARCLAEGVDVPTLDGVAFIDPRRSEVDIVQAVGRAIRKSDTKTVGTIVIPVFIDTDEDAEVALDSSVFKPVWDVIKALRAHDTVLGEELDDLRRQMGCRGGNPKLPSKIHVDVSASVGKEFVNAFEARLVDATTAPWEFWYGLLEGYVAEHGHTRPAALELYEGLRLGQWITQQRYHRNRGNLAEERSRLLQEFPDWTWDAITDEWEEGLRHLERYVKQHGDCLVPQKFRMDDGYKLGQWVTTVRSDYRRGGFSKEREARIQAFPGWSWAPRESRWDGGFRRLQAYAQAHGTTRLVRTYVDPSDGYPLGMWANHQRAAFKRGRLTTERVARLESLPCWAWDANQAAWEEGFVQIQKYAADHGDCIVPHAFKQDGYFLGSWVNNQRTNYSKGTLKPEYAKRLESLPGWVWDVNETKWEEGFRHLSDYSEHLSHAAPPPRCRHNDFPLGSWVGTQRAAYKAGSLTADRIKRLESLPGWSWDPYADKWERSFASLKEYSDANGTSRAAYDYEVGGIKLGQWSWFQRTAYANGKLSPERQRRLEALPGWSWSDVSQEMWDERYELLEKFVAREGHARVPKNHIEDGFRLGQWVGVQRTARKQGKLTDERRKRLEALKGWVWECAVAPYRPG